MYDYTHTAALNAAYVGLLRSITHIVRIQAHTLNLIGLDKRFELIQCPT